jgi:hypothetical protein
VENTTPGFFVDKTETVIKFLDADGTILSKQEIARIELSVHVKAAVQSAAQTAVVQGVAQLFSTSDGQLLLQGFARNMATSAICTFTTSVLCDLTDHSIAAGAVAQIGIALLQGNAKAAVNALIQSTATFLLQQLVPMPIGFSHEQFIVRASLFGSSPYFASTTRNAISMEVLPLVTIGIHFDSVQSFPSPTVAAPFPLLPPCVFFFSHKV